MAITGPVLGINSSIFISESLLLPFILLNVAFIFLLL